MKQNYCMPKIFMLWPKKIHTRNLVTKKKFVRLENSPPPHTTFLMVRPLSLHIGVTIRNLQGER